jgi:lauroyl/myristoyl acyltransferase
MASCLGEMQIQALIRDEGKDDSRMKMREARNIQKMVSATGNMIIVAQHMENYTILPRLCSGCDPRKSAYAPSLTLSSRNGGAFPLLS